jgi:hypothetical protein
MASEQSLLFGVPDERARREPEAAAAPVASRGLSQADVIGIFIAAIALRAIVFAAIAIRHHYDLTDYANQYDGSSYVIMARAMLGDFSQYNDYHGRVFPGYPAMIALVHEVTRAPIPLAAVGIDWIAAATAAACAAMLFRSRAVGWAMVALIAHYLMNSTMALTEAPLLAFTTGGLLVAGICAPIGARSMRSSAGGVLLGVAGLVRPMACFAVLGAIGVAIARQRMGRALWIAAASASVVLGGLLALYLWRGDALAGVRFYATSKVTYDGQLLTWPFRSLITTPLKRPESPARIAYVWGHVAVTLAACGVAIATWFKRSSRPDPRDLLAGPWLLGNTLFALCVGNVWGFECFHRFTIPALPAMFWCLRGVLPRSWWMWGVVVGTSAVIAAMSA